MSSAFELSNGTEEFLLADSYRKIRQCALKEVLTYLGSPQNFLKFIHITGTNGKGSTSAMLASILMCTGYKTGLFTSPHIKHFTERIQIDTLPINLLDYMLLEGKARQAYKKLGIKPSIYDLVIVVAFLYFSKCNCDVVVLEGGIGGKNDLTNVITTTEAAVFTNIGLDHHEILGSTIESVARNKSYIIKEGCSGILYPSSLSVNRILYSMCVEKAATLRIADFSKITNVTYDERGQTFCYKDIKNIYMPLLGEFQIKNATVALETVEALKSRGWNIPRDAVYEGFKNVRWPCRFEVLYTKPLIIADVAHNPQGIDMVCNTVQTYFPKRKIVVIFGCMKDKDYTKMLEILKKHVTYVYFVKAPGKRTLDITILQEQYLTLGGKSLACNDIGEAVNLAFEQLKENDILLAMGTFHIMDSFKNAIRNAKHITNLTI